MPSRRALLKLADGDGIEEFIGDEEHRAIRHRFDAVVPCDVLAQHLALNCPQHGTRFDEMNRCGPQKIGRGIFGDAQHVAYQRAAAGTQFHQIKGWRLAHEFPGGDAPDADQFAEDLRDFRRGDEIARLAQRIARHVVAVSRMTEAQAHVAVERHRPVAGDDLANEPFKRRQGRDRSSSQIPTAQSGAERIMPMVTKPAKVPRCASGSRKNSTAIRDIP